jgi:hypothetical protein
MFNPRWNASIHYSLNILFVEIGIINLDLINVVRTNLLRVDESVSETKEFSE